MLLKVLSVLTDLLEWHQHPQRYGTIAEELDFFCGYTEYGQDPCWGLMHDLCFVGEVCWFKGYSVGSYLDIDLEANPQAVFYGRIERGVTDAVLSHLFVAFI